VLHLQPRVHFQEVELAPLRVEHELDGAGGAVADALAQHDSRVVERTTQRRVQPGSGRLFDHLLVAALRGTISFTERNDVAAPVTEQLHLDVSGALDEAFQVHARVTEIVLTQPAHRLVRRRELVRAAAQRHADTAAASRALEHYREADARRFGLRLVQARQELTAGQERDACGFGERTRRVLHPKLLDLLRSRADEGDVCGLRRLGEPGIFAEKSVARMHGLGAALLRRAQHGVGIQIALLGRRRPDADRRVGVEHVT
jgi:hypothetical protein